MEGLSSAELSQYCYFSGLSDESRDDLTKKLEQVRLGAGTPIITEGTPADYFYFIAQGEVEITKKIPSGGSTLLSVASSGEGFGEIALLTCSHRTSSVTAKTDVTLYRLHKSYFDEVILSESALADRLKEKSLRSSLFNQMKALTPFNRLDPEKMHAVADKLIEREYAAGENIISQGELGDSYYIIKSGRVVVLKTSKNNVEKELAELGEGSAFGEEALIRDLPRNATVRALEKTAVLALRKEDFNRIMAAAFVKNIFPEDIVDHPEINGRYVILDARIPPEFEEEHIEGAINIPIEWLRDQYAELDPGKEYFTYCTNDSRGMVASFLLNMNGFRARTIRGGLSAWTGSVAFGSDGIHLPKELRA